MSGTANLLNGPAHGPGDATSECARLLAEWRQAVADKVAAFHAEPEASSAPDAFAAAGKRKDDVAHRAWATPVSDPVGLRLRAQIVRDSLWPDLDRSGESRFETLLAGQDPKDDPVVSTFDERAMAELVRAVLWAGPALSRTGGQPRASCDVRDLLDRAKAGLLTLQTLWNSHAAVPSEYPSESFAFATSMEFTIDTIEALIEEIAKAVGAHDEERRALPPA